MTSVLNAPVRPYELIEAGYVLHPKEEPFANYVDWHLRNGFVFSTPDFFCMGRMVNRKAAKEDILNPCHLFKPEECDAWYLHALSGDMAKVWGIMPRALGWIGWTRLHDPLCDLHFVETERLRRLSTSEISRL